MHALRVIAVFWILILLGAIALFVAMGWFEDPVTLILACVFLPLACVFPAAVAWKYPFIRIRGQDDELFKQMYSRPCADCEAQAQSRALAESRTAPELAESRRPPMPRANTTL